MSPPRTFGRGIPNFPVVADEEREIYTYNITSGSTVATLTHFWSTACGGNVPSYETEGGITVYRIYIDGEVSPSIEFNPRMATGIGWFAPPPPPPPPAPPHPAVEPELYMIGARGQPCSEAWIRVPTGPKRK